MEEFITPKLAVDCLIFTIADGKLKVLLMKIGQPPYAGKWAIPGGLVKLNESLEKATERILNDKVGVKNCYVEQLYSFSDPARDSRGHSVSVAHFALVNTDSFVLKTDELVREIAWHDVYKLPALAFDHKDIISYGLKRLQSKINYSNIVYTLLPREFTMPEMQHVYEIILNKEIDKRNFAKKMNQLGLIEPTDKVKPTTKRPARMFRFKKRSLEVFE